MKKISIILLTIAGIVLIINGLLISFWQVYKIVHPKQFLTAQTETPPFSLEVDGLTLPVFSTVENYLDAGLENYSSYKEDDMFDAHLTGTLIFKTPNNIELLVTVANPKNTPVKFKDALIAGITVEFDPETDITYGETRLYPFETSATQKYIYTGLGIEDCEMVLGDNKKWIGYNHINEVSNLPDDLDYIYFYNNEQISVNFKYRDDETLKSVSLKFLDLVI